MSVRKVIDWATQSGQGQKIGTIASDFYQYYDTAGQWCWAVDVQIGKSDEDILRCVPVSFNNREIIYAERGKSVVLSRVANNKWIVSGLSKVIDGSIHWIYVTFGDNSYEVVDERYEGATVRTLTYEELGTVGPINGYGHLPYGIVGRFDYDGNLLELFDTPR